jgi:hypothetical protein
MLHTTLCSKQVELGHHTLQLLLAQTHEVIAGKLDELRKNKTVRRDGVLHVFWATTEYLVLRQNRAQLLIQSIRSFHVYVFQLSSS